MSFQYVREMPTVKEILEKMALPADLREVKKKRDEEIIAAIKGGQLGAGMTKSGYVYLRLSRYQSNGNRSFATSTRSGRSCNA